MIPLYILPSEISELLEDALAAAPGGALQAEAREEDASKEGEAAPNRSPNFH